MALSVEQFGKALVEAGLFSADEVKGIWAAIPHGERPRDAAAFARLLIEQRKLTEFQARQLQTGKGDLLVFGEYLVLDEIGAGGMGQVFKAQHRRMRRTVALKVMSAAAMKDEASVKRFQREVEAAARLEHPNIVTAFDAGRSGAVNYLVMQFVDGGDLSDLVKRHGPLPIEQAVHYVVQAARGLSFAHGVGVIHRDIKPANLLCDKKGIVKILDMGLARIESGEEGLTATEQVMGTVDYMSPEQAANTKSADARSDIYSLGCTLWYLLTARKMYDGDSLISRLIAHRDGPLPSLVKVREDAPWPLEQVLHKMVAKRNTDRYQSMDEVVAALEPFAGEAGSGTATGMGSSIGFGGGPKNVELSAFLKTVGPTAPKTVAKPAAASATTAPVEATARFNRADHDTDPQSEVALSPVDQFAKAIGVSPSAKPALKPAAAQPVPPNKLLIAGGTAGAVVVLLALWWMFRGPATDETIAVAAPAAAPQPAAAPKPTAAAPQAFFPANDSNLTMFTPPSPGDYELQTKRITTPLDVDLGGPLTLEAYLTPTTPYLSDAQTMFYAQDLLTVRGGDVWSMVAWTTGGARIAPTSVKRTLGKRVHVAAVYTPQELRLYLDGKLAVRLGFTGVVPNQGRKLLEIGRDLTDRIDEIRVSKTARYAADFQPQTRFAPDADTLLLYHCDEGAGTKLADASGNRRDGLAEAPLWTKLASAASVATPTAPASATPTAGFTPLFNGRDLAGWSTFDGGPGPWQVVDGAITCSGPTAYLYSDTEYEDFHLRVEAQINAAGNGGVYFRCRDNSGRNAPPAGFEAQISSGPADPQRTGSLYNIGRVSEQLVPPDVWFTLEVIAEGPRIRLLVDGKQTVDYTESQRQFTGRRFALQHHNSSTKLAFRKIEVKPLTQASAAAGAAPATSQAGIELLPLIDPALDTVKGTWTRSGTDLVGNASSGAHGVIEIPYRPYDEYDLVYEFTRRTSSSDVSVMLTRGGVGFGYCSAQHGMNYGVARIDGATAFTPFPELQLENGRRYTAKVEVRRDRIRGFLDGRLVSEVLTDGRTLSPFAGTKLRNDSLLGLSHYENEAVYHRVHLLEIGGHGTRTRP